MQRLRSQGKYRWAQLCAALGLPTFRLRLAGRRRRGSGPVLILMYHRVVPDPSDPAIYSSPNIVVSARTFEAQMAWLADHMHPVSLDGAVSALRAGERMPSRSIAVTFDDGWADNGTVAAPILRKYDIPATIYLATDYIGQSRVFPLEHCLFLLEQSLRRDHPLRDLPPPIRAALHQPEATRRLALAQAMQALSLNDRRALRDQLHDALSGTPFPTAANRFLTWSEVRTLSHNGIHFGSHTATHPTLTELPAKAIEEECSRSKHILEERLNSPVRHFAYPGGVFNEACVRAVRAAGYESAVTTSPGMNDSRSDAFRLLRINICERRFLSPEGRYSPALFAATLARLLP